MTCCQSTTASPGGPDTPVDDDSASSSTPWGRLLLSALVAGQSMVFALAINVSGASGPQRRLIFAALATATALVVVLLGAPLFRNVVASLRRGRPSVELLFLLGIAGAAGVSTMSAYRGEGPVFFEVISILLVVYRLGIEAKFGAQRRLVAAARAAFTTTRHCDVIVDACQSAERRLIDRIVPGDLVRCHAGEMIPVDGEIVEGAGFVRAASINGEPLAVARGTGDVVRAGSESVDATLVVRSTSAGDQRSVDRLLRLIEEARSRPSRTERAAERVAAWFVPFVIVVSLISFATWTAVDGVPRGLWTGLAVLLVACPCALGFATPVTVWTGLMRLGSLGIVARRGDVLEDLAAVDTVVFDKTGTLTAAIPVLRELRPRSGSRWAGEDLRAMAAALETVVRHPIGDVFGMSGPSVTSVAAVRSLPGIGVSGTVRRDGVWHTVAVGRADAITSTCCQRKVIAALRDAPPLWTEEHELAVLIDGKVEGLAWAGEVPRPGLDALPSRLTAMGIACEVLSGDKQSRVERLRLADATGDLAPEQKLSRLEDLTAAGRIPMYVGDGLNDLGAMSAAIVTVGVDGGAPGVVGATDLLWDGRDLGAIPEAISFARAALASLRGTLRFAIAYNLIGMALASAGIVHPVVAALLMTGSSLFVTWRAGRLLSSRQPQAAPEKRIIPKPLARPSTPLPSMSVGLLPAEQGARSELL